MTPAAPLPPLHVKCFRACALGTAGFLGLHGLYWLPPIPLPVPVTTLLGFVLFTELYAFFALVVAALVLAPISILVGLLRLGLRRLRRRRGQDVSSAREGRGWFLGPWLHSLAWTLIFCGHLGLDLNPGLTAICGSGALLLFPWFWTALGRVWRPLGDRHAGLVSAVMAGVWWLRADDASVRVAVVAWAIVLLLAVRGPGRRLALRDRVVLVLLCVPAVQMIGVMLPAAIRMHDGRRIGAGMAYSFCEDDAGRLFAVVPRCSANETDKCRKESTVDELDAETLELRAQHRFFSDRYAGRLEQLVCLDDRVQVGMDYTVVDGRGLAQNLLEFRADRPEEFTPNALGGASGDGIAYDRRRQAVFYRSDPDELIRRDLRTGRVDRNLVAAAGSLSPTADIMFDEKRDSLFVARSYGTVVELDPVTFARRATYPILNAWEFTIDEDLDRLYVVGTWGMEVVDLETRRVIRRARVGFGGRRPAIDRRNELIYVPSTGGGRLHVFDRRSLALVGTIPLGLGPRYPYVSERYGYLLATSDSAYYAWNTRDLARQLRRDESGAR